MFRKIRRKSADERRTGLYYLTYEALKILMGQIMS